MTPSRITAITQPLLPLGDRKRDPHFLSLTCIKLNSHSVCVEKEKASLPMTFAGISSLLTSAVQRVFLPDIMPSSSLARALSPVNSDLSLRRWINALNSADGEPASLPTGGYRSNREDVAPITSQSVSSEMCLRCTAYDAFTRLICTYELRGICCKKVLVPLNMRSSCRLR